MKGKWDHPKEDLAKYGYKPYMKYKTLINLFSFSLHIESNIKIFTILFPHF
jgi:hypothetical protein